MPLRFSSSIRPETVRWLWPGYIPFGKVTVLDGDPGLGKSTIMLDIAARLSLGRELPNGKQHDAMGTVLLMGEDGAGDTIVPRLVAAGADLDRVAIRDTYEDKHGNEVPPGFPSDLPLLRDDIITALAGLVVIDPVMSYLDADINSNSDQQVRRALMPLAALAEETGAAIVLLRHLNKSTGNSALYRGGGSIGFVGVARSGLLVAKDPDDETQSVLASTKSNLGPPPPALLYRLVGHTNGAASVSWEGPSGHTATTLVLQESGESRVLSEAIDFLRDLLGDHLPRLSKEVYRQANEVGIGRNTLLRAKDKLGVAVGKAATQDGAWVWHLPAVEESPSGGALDSLNSSTSLNSLNSSDSLSKSLKSLKSLKNPLFNGEDSSPPLQNGLAQLTHSPLSAPVALASGRLGQKCWVCNHDIFSVAGQPLLCRSCKENVWTPV